MVPAPDLTVEARPYAVLHLLIRGVGDSKTTSYMQYTKYSQRKLQQFKYYVG